MPAPSPLTLAAFLAIVASVLLAGIVAYARATPANARRRSLVVGVVAAISWLIVTGLPTGLGLITVDNAFPAMPIFLASTIAIGVLFAYSRAGTAIATTTPLWALVGFQAFRLPLEIVLHLWHGEGVIPPQMTWSGANIDVLSGIIALVCAPLARTSRLAAWLAGLVGAALLINVIQIAVTSLPTPLQRFPDPLVAPLHWPITYIASVCVVGALIGHVLLFRRLTQAAE